MAHLPRVHCWRPELLEGQLALNWFVTRVSLDLISFGRQILLLPNQTRVHSLFFLPLWINRSQQDFRHLSLLLSSSFCLHMCAHVIWRQTERLGSISHCARVFLHFLDWEWQPSAVFHMDQSIILSKFIYSASLSHNLSRCSSCLQSGF